jgi:hypothetical protein
MMMISRRAARSLRSFRAFSSSPQTPFDPQTDAGQRIADNIDKLSGVEAVQALPPEIHRANYITASLLLGFVGYVYWYSMHAVGRGEDPLTNLQQEAAEARAIRDKKAAQERSAAELAELDAGVSEKDLGEGVTLAVAAPDDIATKEEERNKAVLNKDSDAQRSLWNRIVFFWR